MESVLQVGVHVDVKPSSMSLEENVPELIHGQHIKQVIKNNFHTATLQTRFNSFVGLFYYFVEPFCSIYLFFNRCLNA